MIRFHTESNSARRPSSAASRHRSTSWVLLCLLFVSFLAPSLHAARRKAKKVEDKRIYLEHADRLHYDQYKNNDAQILNGNVFFKHKGARLYCDSAHFYEATNSFEAFGHVKMLQGDTLSLLSDYGYYDGNEQLMKALHNVKLRNRNVTLYTDSLYYDRIYNQGYFQEGGKLVDGQTTLTSDWGEYHTDTKMAIFYFDVKMRNKKFYMTSDTLYYDTGLSLAHIVGPTDIYSGNSHIYSEHGYYNTRTEQSRLMDRSVLMNGGKTMIGDSVYYDSKAGLSKAFRNIIFTDTINKTMMTGNYGEYHEATGYAMTTDSAVAVDYSQRDSLFVHADTFKIYTFNINTDSVYRKMHAYHKVRAYRVDVQAVCDSLVYNTLDSCMTMYRDPIVWNMNQQLFGEEIRVYMRDSTIDYAHVIEQAFSIEQLRDTSLYNQVSSKEMFAFFNEGEMREAQAKQNVLIVYYPEDQADSSYTGQVNAESSELRLFMKDRKMERIWMPKTEGTMYPMSQIPPNKRFLDGFAWFDYIRPIDKDDIFEWRGKRKGTELKPAPRHQAPVQNLGLAGKEQLKKVAPEAAAALQSATGQSASPQAGPQEKKTPESRSSETDATETQVEQNTQSESTTTTENEPENDEKAPAVQP